MILLGAIHSSKRYRRPPNSLYGADDYLDEGGTDEAIIRKIEYHLQLPHSVTTQLSEADEEALRLARCVFADLLVYDPKRMAQVKSPDDFFRLFREEAAEGKRYIETRRRGASDLLQEVVTSYLRGA